jgi:hypothetical protein
VNVASFVLRGCPVVVKTAIPTRGAARKADIAIRFWDLMALNRDQKLFQHFGEAGTAVFAVEQVEYGGHDRTRSFDHHQAIIISRGARRDLDHSPAQRGRHFSLNRLGRPKPGSGAKRTFASSI